MFISKIIDRRKRHISDDFAVGRVLPYRQQRMVGPFIYFDHMGPMQLAPGIARRLDIKPHPHIGLATVTYLYDGALTHRDSAGHQQEITPGAVNWMTAGKGITHSERLEYAGLHGANMHGIQSWMALPEAMEESAPTFSHHARDDLPHWQDHGVRGRLIAGAMDGMQSPVATYSPVFYQHLDMQAGARHSIAATYNERAMYVANGQMEVDGQTIHAGQLAIFKAGSSVPIKALNDALVMLFGGEPLGERYIFWNFVSSRRERIRAAMDDWQHQRMPLPIADENEFIELPDKWVHMAP